MSPLQNQWFFRLVEQSAKTPEERLVAVFGVAESLIQAPDIRAKLMREFPGNVHCLYGVQELKAFLTGLASAAGAGNPAGLAGQLTILLQGAIAEELRNPDTGALREAAKAAQVVVEKSRETHLSSRPGWRSAGGVAAVLAVLLGWQMLERTSVPAAPHADVVAVSAPQALPAGVSPDEIDAVLALHEKIERGICRPPNLLALPPGQTAAYMNVVEFRTPDDPAADRRNIREFLVWYDKVRECYDSPVNGHTTASLDEGLGADTGQAVA